MRIGYACLTVGVRDTALKSCTQKNATEDHLIDLIRHNLKVLKRMLEYDVEHGIRMMRISSDIIPFGSSPVNQLEWWQIFEAELKEIGDFILKEDIRVSMHPGQYTVLNSPDGEVVKRAIVDLEYHARFLDTLGVPASHKIILHIGGIYGNKPEAKERFKRVYKTLSDSIKRRLIIENDDRLYTISDVLELGEALEVPVVYDNLHNWVNPSDSNVPDRIWIDRAANTWRPIDGVPKIHYSQQAENKRLGAHTDTIYLDTFLNFIANLGDVKPDIMLEVKDKNLSALKCINTLSENNKISTLEKEWERYKYFVLERSPKAYNEIRNLLKDKNGYPATAFYRWIESALKERLEYGRVINALQHVWGYFREVAGAKEVKQYEKLVARLDNKEVDFEHQLELLKRYILKLATQHEIYYLIDSLYFYL